MAAVTIYWYGPERPASRQCLARCAALFAGEPLAGAEERWPVRESEKGKPFFPLSPQIHCSVTHSGDYWLGAFSSEPIGIDLQIHKPGRLAALSRRFFHPEEDRYLQAFGFLPGLDGKGELCQIFRRRDQRKFRPVFRCGTAGDSVPGQWPAASVCAISL